MSKHHAKHAGLSKRPLNMGRVITARVPWRTIAVPAEQAQ